MSRTKNKKASEKEVIEIKKKAAHCYVQSAFQTSVVIKNTQAKLTGDDKYEPDNIEIQNELNLEVDRLLEADLSTLQKRLASQAILLEQTACNYLVKGAKAEYVNTLETYSKIALKAQDQARKTLATLAEIKNPKRTAFIKQLQMNQFNHNSG